MPRTVKNFIMSYDFAAWRVAMGYTKKKAAEVIGVSDATWWRLEKAGQGERVYVWACYGVRAFVQQKKENQDGAN